MNSSIDFEFIHDENTKNAILLFHGLTGSPFEMKKYGNFLFNHGYNVFCYSFPGHGDRLNEIQTVTWKDWTSFAQEKLDIIKKQYTNVFVSGLCLGAAMAVYLAENNSDIKGVIALSTTLFLDGFCIPWTSCFIPFAGLTLMRFYYTFPEDECLGVKNELTRKSLAKIMSQTTIGMDNYPLNAVNELLKLSKNVRKNLKKLTSPIICIHSKYDNLASSKSAKVVINGISSQIKKYVELNDSYHMVLYDNEKKFVMDTVKEFLDKLQARNIQKELTTA